MGSTRGNVVSLENYRKSRSGASSAPQMALPPQPMMYWYPMPVWVMAPVWPVFR